jgi:hypothetical protein
VDVLQSLITSYNSSSKHIKITELQPLGLMSKQKSKLKVELKFLTTTRIGNTPSQPLNTNQYHIDTPLFNPSLHSLFHRYIFIDAIPLVSSIHLLECALCAQLAPGLASTSRSQQLWGLLLCHCWSWAVEQFATTTSTVRRFVQPF